MNRSMPGLPVHHQLPEYTQTHVHWVIDAIQPSHPLSSPSPAFNLSQNQGLFKWVSSSHQVAKILEFQLQHQSFQWIFRTDFLQDGLVMGSQRVGHDWAAEQQQQHVHWVGDAIQASHPLSSPSPALNFSQHQGRFKWVSSSHQVAKILEFQLQHQSFQWTPRTDLI